MKIWKVYTADSRGTQGTRGLVYAGEVTASTAVSATRKARKVFPHYSRYKVVSNSARRKNPTKIQKREATKKASAKRRVAVALAKFLKQANPAMKTEGATVTRLKGGGFTIRPIKATKRGRR
jgi:hypothetical protein